MTSIYIALSVYLATAAVFLRWWASLPR